MPYLNKILSDINPDNLTSDEKNAVLEITDNLLADVCCCSLVAKKGEGQPFPYENQMVEEVLSTWAAASRVAMDEAIKALLRREGHILTDEVYDVLNIMQGNMDSLFAPFVKTKVSDTLLKSYKRAKKSVFGKYNLKMDWKVFDNTAVEWLQKHHMYWIDTYYSKFVSGKIAETVGEGITQGLGRVEVGNKLKEFFKSYPGVKAKPDVYWRGLAANAMNRSKSFGAIAGYEELEIKEIEILAVMDSRTSTICKALNGKVFLISDAASQRDALMGAESPEDIKQIAAWPSVKQVEGKSGSQLASQGIVLPPYHFHCRTTFVERRQSIRREIRVRHKPAA